MSYYHVIEHFYDDVYNEYIVNKFRDRITHPGFSYNNKTQVKGLLKKIRNEISTRDGDISADEKTSLTQTLLKYVDFSDLRETYFDLDTIYTEQYSKKLSFCDASPLRIDGSDAELATSLSSRIYSIRNAIVHSKDNDKLRYIPFKHDRELSIEVPLLKILAEQIIIRTSEMS